MEEKVKLKKTSVYVMFAIAVAVVCIAGIVTLVNNTALDRSLKSAANTASTDFSLADDYDLGEVMVLDGWVTTRSSRYSSTKSTTAYDVFVVFSARDGLCVAMLNVSSSDNSVFRQVKDYADDSNRNMGDLTVKAVGTPVELSGDREEELRNRVTLLEDELDIACTPVYYDFEFISSSAADYETGKMDYVERKNYGVLLGGLALAALIVVNALRRLFAIRRAEKELAQAAVQANSSAADYAAGSVPQPSAVANGKQGSWGEEPTLLVSAHEETTTLLSPDNREEATTMLLPDDHEDTTTLLSQEEGCPSGSARFEADSFEACSKGELQGKVEVPQPDSGSSEDGFEELTAVLSQGDDKFFSRPKNI